MSSVNIKIDAEIMWSYLDKAYKRFVGKNKPTIPVIFTIIMASFEQYLINNLKEADIDRQFRKEFIIRIIPDALQYLTDKQTINQEIRDRLNEEFNRFDIESWFNVSHIINAEPNFFGSKRWIRKFIL